jgi:hypothetical protein
MEERLFRLDDAHGATRRGRHCPAGRPEDAELLADWYVAFTVEAFGLLPPGFDARRMSRARPRPVTLLDVVGRGGVPRVDGGAASRSRGQRRGSARSTRRPDIGATATARRSRRPASATCSPRARSPCLFTDLANRVSNAIYRPLGYYPVEDRMFVRFS